MVLKKAVIIHCFEESASSHWYQWLADILSGYGIQTNSLEMPSSQQPQVGPWLRALEAAVHEPQQTAFIGHSIGACTILRYAEKLANVGQTVPALVCVAGSRNYQHPALETFRLDDLNFSAVANAAQQRLVIQGTDDPYVPVAEAESLAKLLKASLLVCNNAGHMGRTPNGGMTKQLPPQAQKAIVNCLMGW